MAWTTITDTAKYKRWSYSDIPIASNLSLDALVIPAGRKRLYWIKQRDAGSKTATDQVISVALSYFDTDGATLLAATQSLAYFNGSSVIASMNNSGGVHDNAKSMFEMVWLASSLIGIQGVTIPQIDLSLALTYDSGTEAGTGIITTFDILAVWE